jgi:formate--tetrahydrofolate ligase
VFHKVAVCDAWADGGNGATELAWLVTESMSSDFKFAYQDEASLKEKVEAVATKVYGAYDVEFSKAALDEFDRVEDQRLPICIAKTQYSFSDDPKLLGAPKGWTLHVKDAKLCAGARFVVVYTGDVMTMPGLPKVPAANSIKIEGGKVVGLF